MKHRISQLDGMDEDILETTEKGTQTDQLDTEVEEEVTEEATKEENSINLPLANSTLSEIRCDYCALEVSATSGRANF